MKRRTCSAATVIATQRRVLKLVSGYLSKLGPEVRTRLMTDGQGLLTIDELLEHVKIAIALRVKKKGRSA